MASQLPPVQPQPLHPTTVRNRDQARRATGAERQAGPGSPPGSLGAERSSRSVTCPAAAASSFIISVCAGRGTGLAPHCQVACEQPSLTVLLPNVYHVGLPPRRTNTACKARGRSHRPREVTHTPPGYGALPPQQAACPVVTVGATAPRRSLASIISVPRRTARGWQGPRTAGRPKSGNGLEPYGRHRATVAADAPA